MNKTTTALTVLIEKIDSDISSALSTMPLNTPFIEYLREHRENAISLLQKEREDIRNAFIDGKTNANTANRVGCHEDTGNTYFTKSFTQYKTETNE